MGPTKIYLAVQPSNSESNNDGVTTTTTSMTQTNSQPPPLAPVQQLSPNNQQVRTIVQPKQNAKVLVQPANITQVFWSFITHCFLLRIVAWFHGGFVSAGFDRRSFVIIRENHSQQMAVILFPVVCHIIYSIDVCG